MARIKKPEKPRCPKCNAPAHAGENLSAWIENEVFRVSQERAAGNRSATREFLATADREALAIKEAERGNIGPLKRLYPRLARFLCRPKLESGKKLPSVGKADFAAAVYRPIISQIWAEHRRDRTVQHRGRLSAEDADRLAAGIVGVSQDAVTTARNNAARTRKRLALLGS